ncbi:MAG: hypothetical protein L0K67_14650, partial [Brevibacterium sp.]|nr:hypothetical protein [Brevibacterium sp.]
MQVISTDVARPPSTDTQSNKSGLRADIQGLRALAVGVVLLYHLWPNHFVGGVIGVEVFFVISGFHIPSPLIKSPPKHWRDV